MANRRLNQFGASYENACVRVFAEVAIGATGAPTLTRGKGIASITRTALGNYRLALTDKFSNLLGAQFAQEGSASNPRNFVMTANDVSAATPYVDFATVSQLGDPLATTIGAVEVQTITFATKAASTAGDHVFIYDTLGRAWAISLDITGSDPAPTGGAYAAIPAARKVHVDISGATTAAQVAAAVELAFDALTDVGLVLATDDAAANGTMTFTSVSRGSVLAPIPYNAAEDDVGSILGVVTTEAIAPVAADPVSGDVLWIALDLKNSSV